MGKRGAPGVHEPPRPPGPRRRPPPRGAPRGTRRRRSADQPVAGGPAAEVVGQLDQHGVARAVPGRSLMALKWSRSMMTTASPGSVVHRPHRLAAGPRPCWSAHPATTPEHSSFVWRSSLNRLAFSSARPACIASRSNASTSSVVTRIGARVAANEHCSEVAVHPHRAADRGLEPGLLEPRHERGLVAPQVGRERAGAWTCRRCPRSRGMLGRAVRTLEARGCSRLVGVGRVIEHRQRGDLEPERRRGVDHTRGGRLPDFERGDRRRRAGDDAQEVGARSRLATVTCSHRQPGHRLATSTQTGRIAMSTTPPRPHSCGLAPTGATGRRARRPVTATAGSVAAGRA